MIHQGEKGWIAFNLFRWWKDKAGEKNLAEHYKRKVWYKVGSVFQRDSVSRTFSCNLFLLSFLAYKLPKQLIKESFWSHIYVTKYVATSDQAIPQKVFWEESWMKLMYSQLKRNNENRHLMFHQKARKLFCRRNSLSWISPGATLVSPEIGEPSLGLHVSPKYPVQARRCLWMEGHVNLPCTCNKRFTWRIKYWHYWHNLEARSYTYSGVYSKQF